MKEEWKTIKEYPKYLISNLGRVYSTKTNKIMKPHPDKKGYLRIVFYQDGKQHTAKVHRLVAQHFIENPNGYEQVNHKDENKKNNHVDNLEWCTNDYNNHYGTRRERATKSNINQFSTSIPIRCIEKDIIYPSCCEASRQTKIPQQNITKVCQKKRITAGGYHWEYASTKRRFNNSACV